MGVPSTQTQAPSRQLSPAEVYTSRVIGDERRAAALFGSLPDHIRPERFQRNLLNALMQNPKLMNHDPRLIFREVSKAAALGLLLDPQLGEAYIIESWAGGKPEPQLRTGYRGIMKLARQSDEIANIYPGEVCEHDHFDADEGTVKRLEHKPDYRRSRGKPVCYYACVIYKDGTCDFDVMSLDQIYAIRERSDNWKAFKNGKIKTSPWATDEGEMCKKTVLRRLMKRVPQSPDLSEALAMENGADFAPRTPRLLPQAERRALQTIEAQASRGFAEEDEFAAGHPQPADWPEEVDTPAPPPAAPAPTPRSGAAGTSQLDLVADARQKGRAACDAGIPFEDIPEKIARYSAPKKAWEDGYQERATELEEEMNAHA